MTSEEWSSKKLNHMKIQLPEGQLNSSLEEIRKFREYGMDVMFEQLIGNKYREHFLVVLQNPITKKFTCRKYYANKNGWALVDDKKEATFEEVFLWVYKERDY